MHRYRIGIGGRSVLRRLRWSQSRAVAYKEVRGCQLFAAELKQGIPDEKDKLLAPVYGDARGVFERGMFFLIAAVWAIEGILMPPLSSMSACIAESSISSR